MLPEQVDKLIGVLDTTIKIGLGAAVSPPVVIIACR